MDNEVSVVEQAQIVILQRHAEIDEIQHLTNCMEQLIRLGSTPGVSWYGNELTKSMSDRIKYLVEKPNSMEG